MKSIRFYVVQIPVILCTLMHVGCFTPEIQDAVAPEFSLSLYSTIDFQEEEIFNFMPGQTQPTILNFWFPSCPPCVREIPEINDFNKSYKDSVTVVGIQLIGLDTIESGKDFVKSKNVEYRVGADYDGSITVDYSISGFPTTVFIDGNGHIHDIWKGEIKKSEMIDITHEMLKK